MASHRSTRSRSIHSKATRGLFAALLFVAVALTLTRVLPTSGTPTAWPALTAFGTPPPWETSLPSGEEIGGLAFYDSSGQVITTGSLSDRPVAAYVLGSAASMPTDTKATLYGCTPQFGVDPTNWSCTQISGSTNYPPGASAPASLQTTTLPVVSGAATDKSLQTFISSLPNTLTQAGYQNTYQLRVVTSGIGHAVDATTAYNAADFAVSGGAWTLSYSPNTPSPGPTPSGSASPSASPTASPTASPSASPTASPSASPSTSASSSPSASPSVTPSASSSASPSASPSGSPSASPTASGPPPPWETAAAKAEEVGGLAFYTGAGQKVDGGNLADHPLAAYVLGGAPSHAAGDTKATLYACTPEFQTDPGAWQGCQQLSLSTAYPPPTTAPAPLNATGLPIVTGGAGDRSLASFIAAFPNTLTQTGYQNMYQLRVATSGLGQAADPTNHYDEADILVTGSGASATWKVVYTSSNPDPASVPRPSSSPSPCPSASPCPTPTSSATPSASPSIPPGSTPTPLPSAVATPSPTPPLPAAGVQAVDSVGNTLGNNPELLPGDHITITVSGFHPGASVSVTLHSIAVTEPAALANTQGQVTYPFTVPLAIAAGQHTLVFTSTGLSQSFAFSIAASQVGSVPAGTTGATKGGLPFTGASLLTPTLVGVCTVWSGLVLLFLSRRHSRIRPPGGRHRHGGRRLA